MGSSFLFSRKYKAENINAIEWCQTASVVIYNYVHFVSCLCWDQETSGFWNILAAKGNIIRHYHSVGGKGYVHCTVENLWRGCWKYFFLKKGDKMRYSVPTWRLAWTWFGQLRNCCWSTRSARTIRQCRIPEWRKKVIRSSSSLSRQPADKLKNFIKT